MVLLWMTSLTTDRIGASQVQIMPLNHNHTVFANWTALAQTGEIATLRTLIGSNAQDGVPFVPYRPDGVGMELVDQMTMTFFCPTYQAAKTRTGPVYRYLYSRNSTNVSPKGWMGPWHAAEVPLVFGTHPLFRGDSTELEYATGYAMHDAWLAFVATGGERPSVEGWDARDEVEGGRVVEFGNGVPARLIDTTEIAPLVYLSTGHTLTRINA